MKKMKTKAPANKVPTAVEEEVESDNESLASSLDSDEELVEAFRKGELQPGLNTVLPYAKNAIINNVQTLKSKLKDIDTSYSWIERLDITTDPLQQSSEIDAQFGDINLKKNQKGEVSGEEKLDKAQHDFKREMLFYRQAQAAVVKGLPKLHKLGVVTKRPEDYFAQMFKSDDHMKKVRSSLINKQEGLDKSEKAKKQRDLKKMGKQIQQEVLKKRAAEKRQMLDRVNKYKKGKTSNLDLEGPKAGPKKTGKQKKREYKEGKYGYGGQKKRNKYNTADSAADFGEGRSAGKGRPGAAKGKPLRAGKSKRAQQKLKQNKKR